MIYKLIIDKDKKQWFHDAFWRVPRIGGTKIGGDKTGYGLICGVLLHGILIFLIP
jgi:hypothetical protein